MTSLRNNRGFTLIEAMVATALFIIMVMAVETLTMNIARDGIRTGQKARLQKIARAVTYQVSTNSQRYPGVTRDARFEDPNFKPFDDNTVSDQSCYNDDGGAVALTATDCTFLVSSYQVQQASQEFAPGSDVRMMPLYRLNIRFKYKENGIDKTFLISQYLTPSLWQ